MTATSDPTPKQPKSQGVLRPIVAVATFALLAGVAYVHPALAPFRLVTRTQSVLPTASASTLITAPSYFDHALKADENQQNHATDDLPTVAPVRPTAAPYELPADMAVLAKSVNASPKPIEDPTGHALDAFLASLESTAKKTPGAVTRVAHYGDSLIASDYMASTLRRKFQVQFGDSGHGFVLIAKPWQWYFHYDINFASSDGWIVNNVVTARTGDDLYGYGLASFRAPYMTRAAFWTVTPPNPTPKNSAPAIGLTASKFDVHYLKQPNGGDFEIWADGQMALNVPTAGDTKQIAVASISVPDAAHKFEVRPKGGHETRFFGVAIERQSPGVVWDSLGVLGGRAMLLSANKDWQEGLRARNPALVILQYGTNESEDAYMKKEPYEQALEAVVTTVREALPQSSCLVVGAMDRAAGDGTTRPIILKLNEWQREVALKKGCAFFDTFASMGGKDSFGRWMATGLGGGDYTHPSSLGGALLGELLFASLYERYRQYLAQSPPPHH